jgi:hypothetical protein
MKKHTAKRIAKSQYIYRGYRIEFFDYSSLGDPEGGLKQWNIYAPGEENWNHYGMSLKEAKWTVDRLVSK